MKTTLAFLAGLTVGFVAGYLSLETYYENQPDPAPSPTPPAPERREVNVLHDDLIFKYS